VPGKTLVEISVRSLVENTMRSGNIDNRFFSLPGMLEGGKIHRKLQANAPRGYEAEFFLSKLFESEEYQVLLSGRADGVLHHDGEWLVEEIKTTSASLESFAEIYNPRHWAQLQCYGWMLAHQQGLQKLTLRLTYVQLPSENIRHVDEEYSRTDLDSFVSNLMQRFLQKHARLQKWKAQRDEALQGLTFPFPHYHRGQHDMGERVFKAVRNGEHLFVRAPTGIGKTLATLFPSLKALGEGHCSKVFYLTSKTITRSVVENSLQHMREKGLALKSLVITARDKICPLSHPGCNPDFCPFALGHYDRVDAAIEEVFRSDHWDRELVQQVAQQQQVCPFELSLDLSLVADLVVCDYNYLFDPKAYLRRFFDEKTDFAVLVDEAHNLVDRSREMFSASLHLAPISAILSAVEGMELGAVERAMLYDLRSIQNAMVQHLSEIEKTDFAEREMEPLYSGTRDSLEDFCESAGEFLGKRGFSEWKEKVQEVFFEVHAFQKALERMDERYRLYESRQRYDYSWKVFCVHPGPEIQKRMENVRSGVFFSATLNPMEYYLQVLGEQSETNRVELPSPFPQKNLCLLVDDRIETTWRKRSQSKLQVANDIAQVVQSSPGNSLVFFPSYAYLQMVLDEFKGLLPQQKVLVQTPGMAESDREYFLESFQDAPNQPVVGFAVMGGLFGEGIDLVGKRLNNAIIVGVGFPQICLEREFIKEYFSENPAKSGSTTGSTGFSFSYVYPGMNKVMQAVGRVIRSHKDQGVVLLIDKRFSHSTYKKLFPPEWKHYQRVSPTLSIPEAIQTFWKTKTPYSDGAVSQA